jgi:hypothetical protein
MHYGNIEILSRFIKEMNFICLWTACMVFKCFAFKVYITLIPYVKTFDKFDI